METNTNIRLLGNLILVKVIQSEEKTKSGLIIPKNEEYRKAEVISIGTGDKIEVDIGEILLLDKYQGKPITINEAVYEIIDNARIIGIFEA